VKHCFEHLDATAVMVNENSSFRVDWMPFGGRHTSGYGMGGMSHTMRDLLQLKMMLSKSPIIWLALSPRQ